MYSWALLLDYIKHSADTHRHTHTHLAWQPNVQAAISVNIYFLDMNP